MVKPSIKQRWLMASAIVLLLTVVPYIYYRATYAHAKRFRVVSDGILYRSGCMTAQGFRDAIVSQGIRTVINLMDESPEPDLPESYFSRQMANEAELCRELGMTNAMRVWTMFCLFEFYKEKDEPLEKDESLFAQMPQPELVAPATEPDA